MMVWQWRLIFPLIVWPLKSNQRNMVLPSSHSCWLIDYLNKLPLNFLFCSIFINNVLVFCNKSGMFTPSIRVLALCHLERTCHIGREAIGVTDEPEAASGCHIGCQRWVTAWARLTSVDGIKYCVARVTPTGVWYFILVKICDM